MNGRKLGRATSYALAISAALLAVLALVSFTQGCSVLDTIENQLRAEQGLPLIGEEPPTVDNPGMGE
jgi:hypothetical protein